MEGLTFDFALGRHPENLSGAYYQTMDATVPHQFFATSMLVTPLARGLLGWEPNAPEGKATLAPQPPPSWTKLDVKNLRVGRSRIAMEYQREGAGAVVQLTLTGPPVELRYIQSVPLGATEVVLEGEPRGGRSRQSVGLHDQTYEVTFTLSEGSPAELVFSWSGGLAVEPPDLPLQLGTKSGGLRVLDFTRDGDGWALLLEGDGGQNHPLTLLGEAVTTDDGRRLSPERISGTMVLPVAFQGEGRVRKTLHLRPGR